MSSEGKPKKKKKKQAALAAAEAAAPVAAAIAEVAASLPNGDASPAAVPVQVRAALTRSCVSAECSLLTQAGCWPCVWGTGSPAGAAVQPGRQLSGGCALQKPKKKKRKAEAL